MWPNADTPLLRHPDTFSQVKANWLSTANIQFPYELLALASSKEGRALLEGFNPFLAGPEQSVDGRLKSEAGRIKLHRVTTTLSQKGQVVIPEEVRNKLRLRPVMIYCAPFGNWRHPSEKECLTGLIKGLQPLRGLKLEERTPWDKPVPDVSLCFLLDTNAVSGAVF